tara:strand:+ start:6362 stop:7525 length:1164 start_codon:yes stop_codon:yes gene_type:complete
MNKNKLTILMASRSRDKEIKFLPEFFEKLNRYTKNPSMVDILIKLDDDDDKSIEFLKKITKQSYKGKVDFIITPRGSGYLDLHKSYSDLLLKSDQNSNLYCVLADDINLIDSWDEVIFNTYNDGVLKFGPAKLFTMHQDSTSFGLDKSFKDVIERNEPWPIWTKEWIATCGGFGLSPVTDAWTAVIENRLFEKYGHNPSIIMPEKVIYRIPDPKDIGESSYWNNIRSKILCDLESDIVVNMIDNICDNIYFKITKSEENNPSIEGIVKEKFNGCSPEYMHQKSLVEIFKREEAFSVEDQARVIAKIYKRYIFPTSQRSSSWLKNFEYLVKDLIREIEKETSVDTTKKWLKALLFDDYVIKKNSKKWFRALLFKNYIRGNHNNKNHKN